eukprot:scaffold52505_cov17-Prasinocladus_malaysianus.AAC.1
MAYYTATGIYACFVAHWVQVISVYVLSMLSVATIFSDQCTYPSQDAGLVRLSTSADRPGCGLRFVAVYRIRWGRWTLRRAAQTRTSTWPRGRAVGLPVSCTWPGGPRGTSSATNAPAGSRCLAD